VLRVRDDVIVMQTMLWPDEIRAADFDTLGDAEELRPQELAMASSLIESMAGDFKPEEFTDDYRAALQQVIDAKVNGKEIVAPPEAEEAPSGAIDLMAALRASVERAKAARAGGGSVASGSAGSASDEHEPVAAIPISTARSAKKTAPEKAEPAATKAAKKAAPAKAAKAAPEKAAPAKKAPAAKAPAKAAAKAAEPAAAKKTTAKKAPAKKAAEKKAEAEDKVEDEKVQDVVAGKYEGSAAPNADGSGPAGFDIKGNENSMKYHTTESPWYDQTEAEVWFSSEADAEAAGFTKAGETEDDDK